MLFGGSIYFCAVRFIFGQVGLANIHSGFAILLACERRRISGCRFSPTGRRNDSRKYVCVRRLQFYKTHAFITVLRNTEISRAGGEFKGLMLTSASTSMICFILVLFIILFHFSKPTTYIYLSLILRKEHIAEIRCPQLLPETAKRDIYLTILSYVWVKTRHYFR